MTLDEILRESASRHRHLCPRQVLGARMALCAAAILGLDLPRADKRLLVIAETDGCTVDGIIAATACRVGSRTLRILDFGKVAATFTDTHADTSIRIAPAHNARALAGGYAPHARNRWEAMLSAYQVMPAEELFAIQPVQLEMSIAQIISKAGKRAICERCGEEIINGRELFDEGAVICHPCAGEGYYRVSPSSAQDSLRERF